MQHHAFASVDLQIDICQDRQVHAALQVQGKIFREIAYVNALHVGPFQVDMLVLLGFAWFCLVLPDSVGSRLQYR